MAITVTRKSRPVRVSSGGRGYSIISFSAVASGASTFPGSGFESYYQSIDNVAINMLSGKAQVVWKKQGDPGSGIFIEIKASNGGFVDAAEVVRFTFTAFGITT